MCKMNHSFPTAKPILQKTFMFFFFPMLWFSTFPRVCFVIVFNIWLIEQASFMWVHYWFENMEKHSPPFSLSEMPAPKLPSMALFLVKCRGNTREYARRMRKNDTPQQGIRRRHGYKEHPISNCAARCLRHQISRLPFAIAEASAPPLPHSLRKGRMKCHRERIFKRKKAQSDRRDG